MAKKNVSTFLLRQRAFLKLYLITLTEQERLYGLRILDLLRNDFKIYGYKPNHSEIYKSLHELMDDGILERYKKPKEGMKLQEVVYYRFKDYEEAQRYKKQLKVELDRCVGLLQKAIKDNYK
ncbi:helix-turn-helix transcriptional regulator [Salipaludibacillus aurantiacus]|uniref:Replication termination protein n=1 Tax=Salipaludibacillus aurantiacus TaxID=1601833 RepID=A0A1H9WFD0_9BACI|nr:helix-turn-helix transcriptional regulator [Salipaludibacillus aurantiacus]SES32636.1 replication termination protein [Salipaludibacillus aurantiacus]